MTDKLSHERVMEIKLAVAKSALKQMLEMAQRDITEMKFDLDSGITVAPWMVRSQVKAIDMVTQLSNLASFTLADLKASDEQITGIAHGGVPLDEEEHMNYPAEMEETHD